MQKYKDRTAGSAIPNPNETIHDALAKAHPAVVLSKIEGLDDPLKRHNREVNGQLNSVRLGCYDGVGDLPENQIIDNKVYSKLKHKLEKNGFTKTTDFDKNYRS